MAISYVASPEKAQAVAHEPESQSVRAIAIQSDGRVIGSMVGATLNVDCGFNT